MEKILFESKRETKCKKTPQIKHYTTTKEISPLNYTVYIRNKKRTGISERNRGCNNLLQE